MVNRAVLGRDRTSIDPRCGVGVIERSRIKQILERVVREARGEGARRRLATLAKDQRQAASSTKFQSSWRAASGCPFRTGLAVTE